MLLVITVVSHKVYNKQGESNVRKESLGLNARLLRIFHSILINRMMMGWEHEPI